MLINGARNILTKKLFLCQNNNIYDDYNREITSAIIIIKIKVVIRTYKN